LPGTLVSAFGPRCLYPLVSRLIGQALADNGLDHCIGAHGVVDAERDPVIVAEIELGKIAVDVLFGAMLVGALHAPLEHAEIVLDGVGVDFATDVLASRA